MPVRGYIWSARCCLVVLDHILDRPFLAAPAVRRHAVGLVQRWAFADVTLSMLKAFRRSLFRPRSKGLRSEHDNADKKCVRRVL